MSKSQNGGAAVGVELKHLHRIAEIEVEHLVRVEEVQFRKDACFQQVVDCCALRASSARQIHVCRRSESTPEIPAFHGVRMEIQ